MTTSYLAVVNPVAGNGRCGRMAVPALNRLRAAGIPIDEVESRYPGHGTELTRDAYRIGYRRFIAVGGDGTSFEIVNGLFPEALDGPPPTLAFQPLGTGNSFLRDFSDRGKDHATESLLAGRTRPCDVVKLTHKDGIIYYINILSVGFVADVCMLTNQWFKWMGFAGYGLAVLLLMARFKRTIYPIRLDDSPEVDRTRTALLIFNNSKYTGGTMMLAPHADTNDGRIEIVCWYVGRFGFVTNFHNMYDGTHIHHPHLWHRGARRVEFELDDPINVMVDGEVLTIQCETLEMLPAALHVVV